MPRTMKRAYSLWLLFFVATKGFDMDDVLTKMMKTMMATLAKIGEMVV